MIWRRAGKLTLILGMALQLATPVEAVAQNNNFYRQQQWQQQQQWQRQQEMQRQQAMRQQQMLRDQQMRQQQAQRQMQMQRQRAWQQPRSQPGFRLQQGLQRPQQAQGGFRIFRSPQRQGQQYGRPLPRQQAANQNRFSIFRKPGQQPAARIWRNPQSQNALAAQRRNFFNAARGVTVRSGQFLRAGYNARLADARRWFASRAATAQRGGNNGGARAWLAQWRGKFIGPKVVAGGAGGSGNGSGGGNGGRRPPPPTRVASNDNVKNWQRPASPPTRVPGGGLAAHQAAGSHLLEKHVGLSVGQLRARLLAEPKIPAASSFPNRATAEHVAVATINENKEKIASALSKGHTRITISKTFDHSIGTTILRSGQEISATKASFLITRNNKLPNGYRIDTVKLE